MTTKTSEGRQLFGHRVETVVCQLCNAQLNGRTYDERQAHYENHFSEQSYSSPTRSKETSRQTGMSRSPPAVKTNMEDFPAAQNLFWHVSQETHPPSNYTPGLVPILKHSLIASHAKGLTMRAVLCYEGIVHVATESWDRGWGCGYRNFLMACTSLIDQSLQPEYFPLLDSPTPPGVRNLQSWIEEAWRAGFDEEGATQLKHKIVGTSKWIGTAEVYVAFVSRRIPARLVDFQGISKGADAVIRWVENYFSIPYSSGEKASGSHMDDQRTVDDVLRGASPVLCTNRMPLILQHSGHSRTVVGFEKHRNGNVNLLVMDPSRRPFQSLRQAGLSAIKAHKRSTLGYEKHSSPPSNILHRILHSPQKHMREGASVLKKRRASKSLNRDREAIEKEKGVKRVRGGLSDPEMDVILIDDSDVSESGPSGLIPKQGDRDTQQTDEYDRLDQSKVINFFRLNPQKLRKKDRYQILYFPLDEPLTVEERWTRRVVMSETVK